MGDVLTLGDNAYNSGTLAQFETCFGPSWGRAKARTRPAAGNHEYRTLNAADYFTYFGGAAGDPTKGYYSYDYGAWHVVVLNSGDCAVVACAVGSAQEAWLRADLAASDAACTIAVWHHARFSSGSSHGSNAALQPFYQALYDFDADLILTGHEHNYERFAPQTATGLADPVRGIRQFVVGTGGAGHYGFGPTLANSEVRNSDTFGVLALRLGATGYGWDFVPEAGKTFTDRGSAACHGADGLLSQPGTPLNGATPLTSTSFTDTTAVNGTAHRYVVTAVDDAGQESLPSNEVSATPVPPARITYADDAFGRTRTGGWGNADIGGAYALQGTVADFGVNGSAGTVTLAAAGANRAATLTSVSARDTDLSFRAATSKVPTGSGQYIYGVIRRVSSSSEYRVKLRLASNGSVFFQATSVVNSRETALGSEIPATGVTWTPGGFIRLRAEVSGADPTTVRIRVWADGTTEPSTWPYAVNDVTPTLQAAGAIGVRAYLSSGASNAPVTVTFDDLRATDIAGPNAAPVVDSASIAPGSPTTLQTLTASYAAHDADGDNLEASYQWTRNGIDIAGATQQTLDLAVAGNGDRGDLIRVRVSVDDGAVASSPLTSSPVTVVNSPPALTTSFPDRTDAEGTAPAVDADASDADSDTLTYSSVGLPDGLSIDASTGVISGTIGFAAAGPHAVAISVTDGSLTDTRQFNWTVTDASGPPLVLASDDFSRTRTNGWGSAGTGGAYTLQGTVADYAVNGSEGTVRVAAGANRSAMLTAVSAADVDLSFRAALNKLPAGNSQYLYGISRRISATAEYRAKIRIAPTGAVYLQAGSVVGGIETSIGSEVRVTGLTAAPGTFVW
ncbi:MAG: putative Ig domain-containing protein [Chloroflexi bacterium]|nr:putative Ig domain-containing protein [Chloroflexota bacterium]